MHYRWIMRLGFRKILILRYFSLRFIAPKPQQRLHMVFASMLWYIQNAAAPAPTKSNSNPSLSLCIIDVAVCFWRMKAHPPAPMQPSRYLYFWSSVYGFCIFIRKSPFCKEPIYRTLKI